MSYLKNNQLIDYLSVGIVKTYETVIYYVGYLIFEYSILFIILYLIRQRFNININYFYHIILNYFNYYYYFK